MSEQKKNILLDKLSDFTRDLRRENKGINCYVNPTRYANSIFVVMSPYKLHIEEHEKINLYLCQITNPIGIIYQFNNVYNTRLNNFVFKYDVMHRKLKEEYETNLKNVLKDMNGYDDYPIVCYRLFMKIYNFILDNCKSMINADDTESMLNIKYFAYTKAKDKNNVNQQKKFITLQTKDKKHIIKKQDDRPEVRYFDKSNEPEEKTRNRSPSRLKIYTGRSRSPRNRSSPKRHTARSSDRSPRRNKSRSPKRNKSRSPKRHRSPSLNRSKSRSPRRHRLRDSELSNARSSEHSRRHKSRSLRRSKSPKLEHASPRNREYKPAVIPPLTYQPAYVPQINQDYILNHPLVREKINQLAAMQTRQIIYQLLQKPHT